MVRGMREEKLYSSMEVDDRKEEGIILTHKFIIRFFGTWLSIVNFFEINKNTRSKKDRKNNRNDNY